jgi:hypothetical protein
MNTPALLNVQSVDIQTVKAQNEARCLASRGFSCNVIFFLSYEFISFIS